MTEDSELKVNTNVPSHKFREMVEKIERNKPEDFGGAFLIIPPDGDPISGILVGSVDLLTFWSLIKSKIDIAVSSADDKNKINRAFR